MKDEQEFLVRTPMFPEYATVKALLTLWDGTHKSDVLNMICDISKHTGTPQSPVDWTDPDEWIPYRLAGPSAELALRIWKESDCTVNPRYVYGAYLFMNTFQLLETDQTECFRPTEEGKRFLEDDPEVVRKLDHAEGVLKLLSILAAKSPAKRGDLLEDWSEFLKAHSEFGTNLTFKDTLRRRLKNLVERGLVKREGNTYNITTRGLAHVEEPSLCKETRPDRQLLHAINSYNNEQKKAFRDRLGKMNPYQFEILVKDLLEAMDYEDVVVTKQSGDKGVDVIANYEFGITQIKEVVQVKRHQGTINRPVLDQLRGALPLHNAIRGTIITLGKFAKGLTAVAVHPGAAPITLIDGDKLMDLLLKHEIGIKKKSISQLEIDEDYFAEKSAEELA